MYSPDINLQATDCASNGFRLHLLMLSIRKLAAILLCSFPISGLAHGGYKQFPDQSARWVYQYRDDFGQPWGSYHEYQLSGDTLIGMTVYSKIYDRIFYAGGIREQQKQVWFLPDTAWSEYLLYDFNVVTGDTVTGIYGGTVFGPNDTVQVVYEDSVLCSDGPHHRIWFSNGANWIEGVGSNNYLLMPLLFAGLSGNDYLECFHNDSTTVLPVGASGCFTAIDEYSNNHHPVGISPHPVSRVSKISLDYAFEIQEAVLFDMRGKKVEPIIEKNGTDLQIDRKGIPDGLYLLNLITKDGSIFRTRVIVAGDN